VGDPQKELRFTVVFRYTNGQLQAVIQSLKGPNGIAFSPDEKTLYITQLDEKRTVCMAYDVKPDGGVTRSSCQPVQGVRALYCRHVCKRSTKEENE
jgi:sugar lactone lactonase YvrE